MFMDPAVAQYLMQFNNHLLRAPGYRSVQKGSITGGRYTVFEETGARFPAKPFLAQGFCTDPDHNPRASRYRNAPGSHDYTCPSCGASKGFWVKNLDWGINYSGPQLNSQGILDFGGVNFGQQEVELPQEQFPEPHKFEKRGCVKYKRGFGCDFCEMQVALGRVPSRYTDDQESAGPLKASVGEIAVVR